MAVDRDPQVGDVFQWNPSAPDVATVLAVVDGAVLYRWNDVGAPGACEVRYWRRNAILVPPRPKIRDQWGIDYGGYPHFYPGGELFAREHCGDYPIVRIVNGVVCDEHGKPLEVER